jgi:hypothetical protein
MQGMRTGAQLTRSLATEQQRSPSTQQQSHVDAAGCARRDSVNLRETHGEPGTAESRQAEALHVWAQKAAAGDVTVLRLATLQRWAASGEYESLLERCTHQD